MVTKKKRANAYRPAASGSKQAKRKDDEGARATGKPSVKSGTSEHIAMARRMARSLSFLADVLEGSPRCEEHIEALRRELIVCRNKTRRAEIQATLGTWLQQKAQVIPAQRRIEDAYAAAWHFLSATATPAERARLVRQQLLFTASAVADPAMGVTLESGVEVTIKAIAHVFPELGAQTRVHRELVATALSACTKRGRGNRSRQSVKALLDALRLPSSTAALKGSEKSGRAWPNIGTQKRG